ncbi:DEAD/DEAH box helicase [Pseudoalteromonas ardens]|uniref:DNA helicase n=1 Tax=Pseudoalteromonas rubra TaxID=43658 RepID=A0A0L0EWE7_9GAMM|nr:DEAD/DEAH box helicase [Pseudoalteromonas sp. R96]KNC68762.1 DNA helicase [Pseudoalteromonas rubra]MDK1310058.1 DEAD/DEAH box helicase [Pseudoalteromonas sp. R96]
MSSQLSKEQLLALFEEIKQEQSTQFPLSERFLKQYFNAALLSKAKQYLHDEQICFLEHSEDFTKIDAQVMGNFGNTFTQHIKIEQVKGTPSVEAQCTCSNNPKCRHIAAVLLKLKIDHSGGFGESYLVNDWFNELAQLQQVNDLDVTNVLLFVLESRGNELLVNPKTTPQKPDGIYPLGRALTEHQLNSQVPPKDILESDFRLFSWIRSQNTPGHFELSGSWGFSALQQLVQSKRCFYQSSRKPLAFGHKQHLEFGWEKERDEYRLTSYLTGVEQWQLIKTDPPVYLDTENMVLGRIESELSAQEIAHLHTMPLINATKIEAVIKRFQDVFADNIVPPPQGHEHLVNKDKLVAKLSIEPGAPLKLALSLLDKEGRHSKAKQLNRCEKMLNGLGFSAQQNHFVLPHDDDVTYHWFNSEVRPYLQSKLWQVDELQGGRPVLTPKVTLVLKRDKKHHVIGRVLFDDKLVTLDWDKVPSHEVNSLANVYQYINIAEQFYAIPKAVYDELLQLKSRFSYYLSSSQFKFPLSYASKLFDLGAVESVSDDPRLLDYLEELSKPDASGAMGVSSTGEHFTLRDYQVQGVDWLRFLNRHQLGGILADDMGLGKTLQVIAYFISQHNTLVTKPSLIVCPTSLVGNWQNEFRRFAPHLPLLTVHGAQRDKQLNQVANARFIITTYPLLKRDLAHYSELEFDSIVLDEAQYIKNETAQISKCVKQLSAEFKLCLSGTPVENNLLELKSLLDFVMPDVLGTKQQFKHYFQHPIEKENDTRRAKELQSLIAPFILRRTKSEVVRELPAKTELVKKLEFSGDQADMYNQVQAKVESSLLDLFKEQGVERSKLAFLDALLKLRQICCHPSLVDKTQPFNSAKFDWLSSHLPIFLEEGRKVIIFSQFTSVLDMIASHCDGLNIPFTMLTGQTRQRDKVIAKFTEGEVDVFLISLKAGGTGLNLTQADTVIHFDPWWNPAVENQATDRAYRIGQDKPVFVYKLIIANSIEQKVYQMQKDKQALVDALFADAGVNLTQFNEAQMLEMIKN